LENSVINYKRFDEQCWQHPPVSQMARMVFSSIPYEIRTMRSGNPQEYVCMRVMV